MFKLDGKHSFYKEPLYKESTRTGPIILKNLEEFSIWNILNHCKKQERQFSYRLKCAVDASSVSLS